MSKSLCFVFVAVFVAFFGLGCANSAPTSAPITLKVVSVPFLAFAPIFIAEAEGYFADENLKIEYVPFDSAEKAIPGLLNGDIDVGGGTISAALVNAMRQNPNLRIVADQGNLARDGCTYAAFVARRALVEVGGLNDVAQLKDKRVVVTQPAAMEGYRMEKLLATGGMTLDAIQIQTMPSPAQLEAFKNGAIDLTGTSEPWITRYVRAGDAVIWKPAQEVIPNFQISMLTFGPNLIQKNPDAGIRFMTAYLRAARKLREGKTERNVEILAQATKIDPETLKQACWPPMRADGQLDTASILDFQAWAKGKGYVDEILPAEKFWDPRFVQAANAKLNAGQ